MKARNGEDLKVFILGMHKTGTSSVSKALNWMGLNLIGCTPEAIECHQRKRTGDLLKMLESYDGAEDDPWYQHYQIIQEKYPTAFFILTKRDPEKWFLSMKNHFIRFSCSYYRDLYKVSEEEIQKSPCVEKLITHNKEVESFFLEKNSRFLSIDITETENAFQVISDFIGVPVPKDRFGSQLSFPHANTGLDRKIYSTIRPLLDSIQNLTGINLTRRLRIIKERFKYNK